MTKTVFQHIPVLLQETIAGLKLKPGQKVIDCTLGGGGHAEAILKQIAPRGQLLAIDRDPEAIKISRKRLATYQD